MQRIFNHPILILPVLAVGYLLYVIQFGTHLNDESYFIAVAVRFFNGDLPFVDEFKIIQTTSLFLFPFSYVFLKITGNTDGIVFYCRILYVLFNLVVGYFAYVVAKKFDVGRVASVLIGTFFILFVPMGFVWNTHTTLGDKFLMLGLISIAAYYLDESTSRWLFAASFLLSVAALLYPPFVFGSLALGLYFFMKSVQKRKMGLFLKFMAMPTVFMILFAVIAFPLGFLEKFRHISGHSYQSIAIRNILNLFLIHAPNKFLIVGYAIVFAALYRFKASLLPYLLLSTPLVARLVVPNGNFPVQDWQFTVTLMALPYFFVSWKKTYARVLFFTCWVPSLCATISTTIMSYAGAAMGGLGSSAAMFSMLVLFVRYFDQTDKRVVRLLAISFVAFMAVFNLGYIPRKDLGKKANVEIGPMKYLSTSTYTKDLLEFESRTIRKHAERATLLGGHPGTSSQYLQVGLKPAVPSLFTCPEADCYHLEAKYLTSIIERSKEQNTLLVLRELSDVEKQKKINSNRFSADLKNVENLESQLSIELQHRGELLASLGSTSIYLLKKQTHNN